MKIRVEYEIRDERDMANGMAEVLLTVSILKTHKHAVAYLTTQEYDPYFVNTAVKAVKKHLSLP